MFKKIALAASLLFGLSGVAHAEFVFTDWKMEGDNLGIVDTDTGVEWLKFSETGGKTINQVMAGLDTVYDGWRLPTMQEVGDMHSNFVATYGNYGSTFTHFFGLSDSSARYSYSNGLHLDSENNVYITGGFVGEGRDSTSLNYLANGYTLDMVYGGTYLVSDGGTTLSSINDPSINVNNPAAPVNNVSDVPVMFAIGGLAMLGLGLRRKRK